MLTTELVNLGFFVTVIDKLMFTKDSLLHLYSKKNFKFYNFDIRDRKELKKILKKNDIIIPLAAIVGAPLCQKYKKDASEINLNIIEFIVKNINKNQKIIYPTTNSGYGIGAKNKFCDENSPLNPISHYGVTKNLAEKAVLKFKNSICFRLATVFGYSFRMRTDLLVNNFVKTAIDKKKLVLFQPNFRRNFIHINDVVDAFIFAIYNFNKLKGHVYNLGLSNANITKLQLAKKIKKNLKKIKIEIKENRKDPDQRDYFVSNKKIERKGFKAKVSLEDGIEELIRSLPLIENIKNNY